MDRCTLCKKEIPEAKSEWLEYDQGGATDIYAAPGSVPAERSQGLFIFHRHCANLAKAKHKRERARLEAAK